MEDQEVQSKVVIVTGAAAGIGRVTALRFAAEGASVAGWDVSDKAAAAFETDIRQAGGEPLFQVVNVTDAQAVEAAVNAVIDKWGKVDVVVNNAGILRDSQLVKINAAGEVKSMPEASWDSVIDVNLKGVFITTRAVVPQMIRQGGGVILNAASVVALYGNFGQTNYVATKAGVIGMTRTWARELGKYNIRVNAVAPGFIATDMLKSMPKEVLDGMIAHTPMKRIGSPEDVANAYFWLASDQASFVHGAVLSVDGGMVIGT
ncbi:MAG: beta-ketoacyl-ACP reductase [Terracidiphilus sp.]|jgi:3-oxoacyl-[acyl-carrier protein] reductase